MKKKAARDYIAPADLEPFERKDNSVVHLVIETPKGSRNKYAFDPKFCTYRLSKVLPDGMEFPYDFGFVPSTRGDDGDPLDVLLLMDQPAFAGCVVASRLIGVIEGEQEQDGKKERNDRLMAVAVQSHRHSDIKNVHELNPTLVKELEQFFVNYHKIQGSTFRVLSVKGPKTARRLLQKGIKRAKAH